MANDQKNSLISEINNLRDRLAVLLNVAPNKINKIIGFQYRSSRNTTKELSGIIGRLKSEIIKASKK